MKSLPTSCLLLAILLVASVTRQALSERCEHCNCQATCQKVCRLVHEEKKVEITCWGCKCEDFCVPGPSTLKCSHCECITCRCVEGASNNLGAKPKKFLWAEWLPGCATIHTKKKLMKRTITKTIPSYEWVVENICDSCEKQMSTVSQSKP